MFESTTKKIEDNLDLVYMINTLKRHDRDISAFDEEISCSDFGGNVTPRRKSTMLRDRFNSEKNVTQMIKTLESKVNNLIREG